MPPPHRPAYRPPQRPPMHHDAPPPFAVGRPLPPQYLGYNYRVDHWQRHGLPRPRPGHHWVQYGGDYVLVSPRGIAIQIFAR
jgi:Ni/Co efflux regulator RcnB